MPSITAVRMSGAKHRRELPLLVLGPAWDISAVSLWSDSAAHLADAFDLVAWDLPGHGYNTEVGEFTVVELAAGVLAVVDDILASRDELGGSFAYAGASVGGEVGLQLQLDVPERVRDVVALGELVPDEAPEEVARLIGTRLLGEEPPRDEPRSRLLASLTAQVEAARADGVTTAEVRELLQQVEAALDD